MPFSDASLHEQRVVEFDRTRETYSLLHITLCRPRGAMRRRRRHFSISRVQIYIYIYIYIFIAFSLCVCACGRDAKNTNSCERSRGLGSNWSKRQILPLWHFFFVFCFLERRLRCRWKRKDEEKKTTKTEKKFFFKRKERKKRDE